MAARILVVEDNPANLELMSYLLRAYGYTVSSADNGEDGLEAAARDRPDLILCDVQLPRVDGFEVARRLKADAALKTIPLLAVTALAMVGDREKLLATGFDGYLGKPIDPEAFVFQIERFLRPELRTASLVPAAAAQASERPAPSAGAREILVVDDRNANLDFAVSLLEHSGYRVVPAREMGQALALARERQPDLILADVWMAEGSGYELIERIKAEPQLRAIPFVFITSTMVGSKDRARGLALGAARYLVRPIEPEDLLAEIEACLPRRLE